MEVDGSQPFGGELTVAYKQKSKYNLYAWNLYNVINQCQLIAGSTI